MRFYSYSEMIEILEIEAGFLEELVHEEIICRDAPAGTGGEFSGQMLERARVAYNLVHDLDVNLPGAAIIVRMREEISGLRHQVEGLLNQLRERSSQR